MSEPTPGRAAGRPVVQIGGADLPPAVASALRTVTVDSDLDGPDSLRLVLDDPGRDVLSGGTIDLASEVTVVAGRVGEATGDEVFSGVVYALGFEYDDRGARTVVTAYDRSYALYNGLHTTTYADVTDSDLASRIAQEMGLQTGTIAATSVVHDHIAQVNETYVQFLSRRARQVDRVLRVTGSQLHFAERADAADAPVPGDLQSRDRLQLVPGSALQRLSIRVTAAQQVEEVQVRGWDPETKAEVVATATPATRAAQVRDTPESLARSLGGRRHVEVDTPLTQQAQCDALAQARAEQIAGAHVHAEGIAYGDPRLLAGTAVSLGATGGRLDGQVTLTRAVHTWDDRGYRTAFVASGGHDRSLLGLVTGGPTQARGARHVAGLTVAVVTNAQDPLAAGRVKLRFPWLDDEYESDWARTVQPGGGPDRGLQAIPEVDDEVVVGFEHGDPGRPYVLGGVWNGVDAPPRGDAVDSGSGAVTARVWRSRTGHEVVLDDAADGGGVVVRTGDGRTTVHLDVAAGEVRIETEGSVAVTAVKDVRIEAQGDLALEAAGSGTFKATGDLTLQSSGRVVVKGSQIALN